MTNIAGMSMNNYCPLCKKCSEWSEERKFIEQQVRESAYHIIDAKGFTQFAVGLALVRITEAILRKQNSVLTVSVLLDGEFGLKDVCLSVPSIISDTGMVKIIDTSLPSEEMELLRRSAGILKNAIYSLSD
ncbi:MAG: hypothetical protein WBJ37_09760 [Bacteroidales bacterium]